MKKTAMRRLHQEVTAKRLWLTTMTVLAVAALILTATAGHPQRASAAIADEGGFNVIAGPYAAATEWYAQGEPARYNLSSIQSSYVLQTLAGQAATTQIAFYNIDGNRTATVSFEVAAPQGWSVEIGWPGRTATTTALTVSPELPAAEPPALLPEGTASIYLPGRGYLPARAVEVIVTVPKGTTVQAATITVTALATYAGQAGAVGIAQSRDFQFNVRVLAPGM